MATNVGSVYRNKKTGGLYRVYHVEVFKRSKAIPQLGDAATVVYLELTKRRLLSFNDQVLVTITEDNLDNHFELDHTTPHLPPDKLPPNDKAPADS